jgi:hypothetical protein
MSSAAAAFTDEVHAADRLEVLVDQMAELVGQRNAIDGRIVDIVAEIDHANLGGIAGARSIPALVAWMTGVSPANAKIIATIAHRSAQFPLCVTGMREGRFSVDQVGTITNKAADGSDAHYAQLAESASVTQLRTAVNLAPRPDPDPKPEPERSISKTVGEGYTTWRIRLPRLEAAKFDAALHAHRDGLIADWKRDHGDDSHDEPGEEFGEEPGEDSGMRPPFPTTVDAFMSLVDAGWDTEAARRPHGQHSTVVVHLEVEQRTAALHLGPLLSDAERRYLLCDATCEAWFERAGRVIGSGRATRTISRRLRRALEHRDRCCVVPGCGATRGLHAHHLRHWEDGGPTELFNLVLLCPFHHRLHHRGGITITGPADRLVVTDADGDELRSSSLARPPTQPPPAVAPCTGPSGERAQWWWYEPYDPNPPPPTN